MKSVVRAEIYKLKRSRLLIFCSVSVYLGTGLFYGFYGAEIFREYEGLELFALPAFGWLMYCFATVVAAGLFLGGDFSRGTVKNALAVGVSKRDYYFVRLGIQMLMTAFSFAFGQTAYVICHLVWPWEDSNRQVELLGVKLAVYSVTALLQMLAYVALINAICYFVKKQVVVMVTGVVLIYMEAIIRQLAEMNDLEAVLQVIQFMPARVLYRMFEFAVYDQVFTPEFLKYGLSALVIIGIGSAAGYVKFEYYPGEC